MSLRAAERATPAQHPRSFGLVVPALVFISLFAVLPTVLVLVLSFFDYHPLRQTFAFAGTDNYQAVLDSGEIQRATWNTVKYTLMTVPSTVVLGLLIALAIHNVTRAAVIWRTAFFLPVATTLAAMAVVWQLLYYPRSGVVDRTLGGILGVGDWLGNPELALPALAIIGNWHGLGTAVILFLAGLAAVPADLHEAARLDGARAWSRFWHVTLPIIGPSLVFVVVLVARNALVMFDEVQVITRGGPLHSTETLGYALYRRGISYLDVGGAAVLTVALLVLLLIVTVLQLMTVGRHFTKKAGA